MQTATQEAPTGGFIERALAEAGIEWTVFTEPAQFRGIDSGRHFWTVKDDGEEVTPLEVVGADWHPIQNAQAFDFANRLIPGGTIEFDSIKEMRGGRKVLMECHLPEGLRVAGEPIDTKLHFINGFDGHTVWGALFSPTRRYCTNQLVFPRHYLPGRPQTSMKVKHTTNAGERIAHAYRAVQMAVDHGAAIRDLGEGLSAKRMSEAAFDRFLEAVVPTADLETRKNKRALTNARGRQDEIREVWIASDNLNDIRHTQWGALNALVEWNDHNRTYASADVRQEAIWRGPAYYAEALKWADAN